MVEQFGNIFQLLQSAINKQKWTYAKSYANFAPHEYFIEENNAELFFHLSEAIEEYGENEPFHIYNHVKYYRYFYLGDYKYWVMGNVLNRCKREQNSALPGGENNPRR